MPSTKEKIAAKKAAMTPDEKALARKKDAMRKRADKLHKINVSILIFLTSFFLSSF